jgi:hypothetical protein
VAKAKSVNRTPTAGQTRVVFVVDSEFCATLGEFLVKRGGQNKELTDFGHELVDLVIIDRFQIDPVEIEVAIQKKTKKEAKEEKATRGRLVKEAKRLHKKGQSYRAIGKQLGVSAITVSRYCNK